MKSIANILEKNKEEVFHEFFEMYSIDNNETTDIEHSIANYFRLIFEKVVDENETIFVTAGASLIEENIKNEIPYIVLINELSFLKSKLIHIFLELEKTKAVLLLCRRFDRLENKIAESYLCHYIQTLQKNINLRLLSLADLVEQEIIHHYELHVKWLYNLSEAIKMRDFQLIPEIDPTQCEFGKWLLGDAKLIITNDSKYTKLIKLHERLHYLGKKIASHLQHVDENFHVCVTYLEKADLTSMEIGTELMLIDNKRMIARATKDKLTGVLNRSLLEQLFFHQYEIALATNSSYVFAMCDLDYFKKINDNYGHLTGDAVLKSFADLLKENLRASDIIVRFGGEEFILILPALNYIKGKEVLKKLCTKVKHSPVQYESNEINLTVSIGIIEITPQEQIDHSEYDCFSRFLDKADQKLYLAKDNGRNRVE